MLSQVYTRTWGLIAFAAGLALIAVQLEVPAVAKPKQEQETQSQSQQAPPTQTTPGNQHPEQPSTNAEADKAQKKTRKIWTNDEVIQLRTPADVYQDEEEARTAAEAAAKAAAKNKPAKPADASPEITLNLADTQKEIALKQGQIDDEQNGLERMLKDLPNAPDDQKAALQKEIDRVAADLPKVRNQLKALQDHLAKLTGLPSDQTKTPAAPPASL